MEKGTEREPGEEETLDPRGLEHQEEAMEKIIDGSKPPTAAESGDGDDGSTIKKDDSGDEGGGEDTEPADEMSKLLRHYATFSIDCSNINGPDRCYCKRGTTKPMLLITPEGKASRTFCSASTAKQVLVSAFSSFARRFCLKNCPGYIFLSAHTLSLFCAHNSPRLTARAWTITLSTYAFGTAPPSPCPTRTAAAYTRFRTDGAPILPNTMPMALESMAMCTIRTEKLVVLTLGAAAVVAAAKASTTAS
jgi:hypothetical protein